MALTWRRFQFFDRDSVEFPASSTSSSPSSMLFDSSVSLTSSCSGRSLLFFSDSTGQLRCFTRSFHSFTWPAHEGPIVAIKFLPYQSGVLLTLGSDGDGNSSIKLWLFNQQENQEIPQPFCARSLKLFSKAFPAVPITCFDCLPDLSQISLGLSNGAIMLFDGNLLRDRSPKQSLIEREGNIVTGMHFRWDQQIPSTVSLFVCTPMAVRSLFTRGTSSAKTTKVEVDNENGSELRCSTLNQANRLIIANQEAVFFYEAEEKQQAFGFKGPKKLVFWFSHYLVLVQEVSQELMVDSASASNLLARDQLTVYDLNNKFIAYQGKFDPILELVHQWGCLFVVTEGNNVFQLSEKELTAKMEMLFKKNLYQIALALAQSSNSEESFLMEIYEMYGDHLYSKGDYDGAIQQYLETIRWSEPSSIIRKFLDAQRIHNLTKYLEALHRVQRANADHTTLLLNCYAKLKDKQKLEEFIQSTSSIKFDVKTAICVCRQANYFDQALMLAKREQEHPFYIKILLEDCRNYEEALSYIKVLDRDAAETLLREHGQLLLTQLPTETTDALILLCTRWPVGDDNHYSAPESFLPFFVEEPSQLQRFLEQLLLSSPSSSNSSSQLFTTLLELYLRQTPQNPTVILNLLKSSTSPHDGDMQALILCKFHQFEKGILFLYAKLKLYQEIVLHHCERAQHAKLLKACKKFGTSQPELWILALNYFASYEGSESVEEAIQICLEPIERFNLLPPLRAIQILSQSNSHQPLAVVKEFLIRTLKNEANFIASDQHEIDRFQSESAAMKEEIKRLQVCPITFQGIKCHACSNSLQLPAIHFLCQHSYHSRCLLDQQSGSSGSGSENFSSPECPKCSQEYRKVKEIKESMKNSANQHDRFFKLLEESNDGFATVAEYFGRGILEQKENKE
jgi:hypothetical protein